MLLSRVIPATVLSLYAGSTSAYINYTTLTGIFLQDDPSTNVSTFNFTSSNFGLINRTYPSDSSCPEEYRETQWQRLAHYIYTLNEAAPSGVQYKLLYMGRHGEGYHNAAESYYGTPAWNCYYSELDGNATVTWADAHLTPKGVTQALSNNKFWATEIETQKIPVPGYYYTSPLTRCLQTANLTFLGLSLPKEHPFVPEVKELLRESISGHTCDRRGSKTYIHQNFPIDTFESGFPENDPYWEALHGETDADQLKRSKTVIDDVFANHKHTYLSITSHSGEIASILQVLGHQKFPLSTGAVIPVLVQAAVVTDAPPTTAYQAFTALATCASPPKITAASCDDCSCCTVTA